MRAIIETSQTQVAVELDSRCKIPRLDAEVGKEIDFEKVLLIAGGQDPIFGNPYIKGASVKAEVVGHGRLDKVKVFKFKRRTKYRRMRGHRQDYTEILVKKITH